MLNKMPTELLVEIFKESDWISYKISLPSTCQRFRDIMADPLMRHFDILDHNHIFDTNQLVMHGGDLDKKFNVTIRGTIRRPIHPVDFKIHPVFALLQLRCPRRDTPLLDKLEMESQFNIRNVGLHTRDGFKCILETPMAIEPATSPPTSRLYMFCTAPEQSHFLGVHGDGNAVTVGDVLLMLSENSKSYWWYDVGDRFFKTVTMKVHWYDPASMNRPSVTLEVNADGEPEKIFGGKKRRVKTAMKKKDVDEQQEVAQSTVSVPWYQMHLDPPYSFRKRYKFRREYEDEEFEAAGIYGD